MAYVMGMDAKKLSRWYKDSLSGYKEAKANGDIKRHDLVVQEGYSEQRIKVPIFKPDNLGDYLAIDEKTIDGICYTILSNRETNKIVMMAATLKVKHLTALLSQIPVTQRYSVKSITRDLSASYEWLCRACFPNAYQVADKFHIIREVLEQLQSTRIRHRQELLALERKKNKTTLEKLSLNEECANGDTLKQLLHRSRGLLFKREHEWTEEQSSRAIELFKRYPEIKEIYKYCQKIRQWYNPIRENSTPKKLDTKKAKLDLLIEEGLESEVEEMKNIATYMKRHKTNITYYFIQKETNAKAEALNQNLQRFISVNYGARNSDFFLYRVNKQFS